MDRRYQVFVSSTYTDLVDERRQLIQVLLEMDCMPAGMELFPAANEDQWDLIKAVIDDSDYYVVVVAGRYGSADPKTGVGFTEMEYDYAVQSGKPVFGFVHSNPGSIPADLTEATDDGKQKLKDFREKVQGKPVKFFTSPEDLGAKVILTLNKAKSKNPTQGWVRGEFAMTPETRAEISELRAQVAELEKAATSKAVQSVNPDDLKSGDDEYDLQLSMSYMTKVPRSDGPYQQKALRKQTTIPIPTTWNTILASIGPALINEATQNDLIKAYESLVYQELGKRLDLMPQDYGEVKSSTPAPEGLNDIIVQLFALDLIAHGVRRRSATDRNKYWSLTPLGQDTLMKLRAIRKDADTPLP